MFENESQTMDPNTYLKFYLAKISGYQILMYYESA